MKTDIATNHFFSWSYIFSLVCSENCWISQG